jgi:preprotein translocase subunit YajC
MGDIAMSESIYEWLMIPSVLGAPPVGAPAGAPAGGPGAPVGGGGGGAPGGLDMTSIMLLMLGVFVVMMLLSGSAAKKEKKKRAAMMSALGKHDRVQTQGGVIGTIVEVKDDEVVLRVDETTNTRIRFAKSAVTGVLRKGKGAETVLEEPVEAE